MLNYKKDKREVKIMSENDNKNINNEENTNVNENNGQTTETQNDGHVQNVVDNIKLIIASVLVIVAFHKSVKNVNKLKVLL